jgi:hypothetical protein
VRVKPKKKVMGKSWGRCAPNLTEKSQEFSRSPVIFLGFNVVLVRFHAAFSSGRSTISHSDNPLHFRHLGKLASLVSMTSTPQHSDTYKPDSFTS